MTELPEAPTTGPLKHLSLAKLVGGAVLAVLAGVASTSFYAGQRVTGLSDKMDTIATKMDSNQDQVTTALRNAQAAGVAARSALEGRVTKLETRQDRDDQTNRDTAAAVAGLQGQVGGMQRSVDSLIALILSRGKLQQESRADR